MSRGCLIGRKIRYYIGEPIATSTAMQALGATDEHCFDGCITVKLDDSTIWVFDTGSAAVAGPGVIVPTYATGRWLQSGSGGSLGVGTVNLATVRGASTADIPNLAAFTVAGVDGLTYVEGERILLKNQTAPAQNGLYRCGAVGGGTCALTRASEADASAEVTAGMLVYVSEGTAAGDEWYYLTTNDAIVLGTTELAFVQVPSLSDLAAVTAGTGADLIGVYDPTAVLVATTVRGAAVENATNLNLHRPGSPMFNRLTMLGAPGAIAAADTVTIGADTYEFRADTPPTGGTAGRVWIYQGVNSAASRVNFINAVNGVVDAPTISRTGVGTAGTNVETVLAAAGTTLGVVNLWSAATIGVAIASSAVATVTTQGLTTATDIWDQGTMYSGQAQAHTSCQMSTIMLTADMVTKGDVEFWFGFTPTHCWLNNRNRAQDEAYAIAGNSVSLTLAGGVSPNNQAADVVDVVVMG
jgi:hypothetical protein